MKKVALWLLCLQLAGCSTVEFVNGPKIGDTVVRKQWHHLGLNGLVEYSSPVDLDYDCDDKQWEAVTIEKTFFNVLAEVSWPLFSIYSPWSIVYECRTAID